MSTQAKCKKGIAFLLLLIAVALAAGAAAFVVAKHPDWLDYVDQKLKSIITPNPPIGNLSVVRDLKGTWKSALKGKGIQLYGSFTTGPGTTKIYEDGDVELKITDVKNNIASGKIRYTNLCVTGSTTVPGYGTVSVPKVCTSDTGYQSIQIRVSGTKLDFGAFTVGDTSFSMQGSYTTDIISGTMTVNLPAYGVVKGEFRLMRQK